MLSSLEWTGLGQRVVQEVHQFLKVQNLGGQDILVLEIDARNPCRRGAVSLVGRFPTWCTRALYGPPLNLRDH